MRTSVTQNLNFSWEYVTSLFWARYPNPFASHVLYEDTLERRITENGSLYTKRLIVKRGFGRIPFWLKRVLSNRQEMILEESIIDLSQQKITTVTKNVGGLARYAVIVEKCDYTVSSENSNSTHIDRSLNMQSSLASKILLPLWSFFKRRYNNSAEKSLQGYMHICNLNSSSSATYLGPGMQQNHTYSVASSHLKDLARGQRPRIVMAESARN